MQTEALAWSTFFTMLHNALLHITKSIPFPGMIRISRQILLEEMQPLLLISSDLLTPLPATSFYETPGVPPEGCWEREPLVGSR